MQFESGFSLSGGFNNNYVEISKQGSYLFRVPQHQEDLTQEWKTSIYPAIGFEQDGGRLHIRTPREQYEFSRRAAAIGLRVLAADQLNRNTLRLPLLQDAQRLHPYLRANPTGQTRIFRQLFADLRKAHANGFVYGDRCSNNILVQRNELGAPELVHIDFDMEITGPTAKELEIAEVTRDLLCLGESTLEPLAKWLGAPDAWFDLNAVSKYLNNYAIHWQRDHFRLTPGDLTDRLLTAAHMISDANAHGNIREVELALSGLHAPVLRKDMT